MRAQGPGNANSPVSGSLTGLEVYEKLTSAAAERLART